MDQSEHQVQISEQIGEKAIAQGPIRHRSRRSLARPVPYHIPQSVPVKSKTSSLTRFLGRQSVINPVLHRLREALRTTASRVHNSKHFLKSLGILAVETLRPSWSNHLSLMQNLLNRAQPVPMTGQPQNIFFVDPSMDFHQWSSSWPHIRALLTSTLRLFARTLRAIMSSEDEWNSEVMARFGTVLGYLDAALARVGAVLTCVDATLAPVSSAIVELEAFFHCLGVLVQDFVLLKKRFTSSVLSEN